VDSAGFPLTAANGQAYANPTLHNYWDLSRYDGVVVWARRGPDGQSGLLVSLQDKFTSDALNRQNNTYCQRIKTCAPTCENGLSCVLSNLPGQKPPLYRCVDPTVKLDNTLPVPPEASELWETFRACGQSACVSPSYEPDLDFDNITQCQPYEFSAAETGYYCYNSTPPPDPSEECGDGFVTPITLSTEWQIYVLPFSQFNQIGFGKQAPYLDLHSVYQVAFLLPVGYTDVYIDNVTFYRRQ
jgi:hypothetical protein